MAIITKNFTAPWLADLAISNARDNPAGTATYLNPMSSRTGSDSTGYNVTTARTPDSAYQLPLTMYILNSDDLNSGSLPADRSFSLLINPSELAYGSTQVISNQYSRNGFINSLWGPGQGTLVGSGFSAAFLGPVYGLDGPSVIMDEANMLEGNGTLKYNSLGYANVMSMVALMRNNGYYQLMSKNVKGNNSYLNAQDGDATAQVTTTLAGMARSKSRVIHVMGSVAIDYDGTTYVGAFNTFSIEASVDNPFRFSYSFEFVVTGLLGDRIDGHICDGSNQETGVVVGLQGSSFLPGTIEMDKAKLQVVLNETLSNPADGGITLDTLITPEKYAEGLKEALKSVNVKKDASGGTRVNFDGVQPDIYKIFPVLDQVYQKYVGHKPTITSARDSQHSTPNSLHYRGLAVDVRTNDLIGAGDYAKYSPASVKVAILGELKKALNATPGGSDYDVILEVSPEHLHIEYDPHPPKR